MTEHHFSSSDPNSSSETLYQDADCSLALVSIDGVSRSQRNLSSRICYTILSGSGLMEIEGVEYPLQEGSKIRIPKGVVYRDEGTFTAIAFSEPPFDTAAVEFLD